MIGISVFADKDDFKIKKQAMIPIKILANLAKSKIGSAIIDVLFVHGPGFIIFDRFFAWVSNSRKKSFDEQEMDVHLWKTSDTRTHAQTALDMFKMSLIPENGKKIKVPLHYLISKNDQYFDEDRVHESLNKVYKTVVRYEFMSLKHAPSVVDGPEEVANMMPASFKKVVK